MTDYNTLIFTFLWCDLVQELARVYKIIQRRDLQISDVGQSITLLCIHLQNFYLLNSEVPESLPWIDGCAPYIMQQFWGKNYLTSTFNFILIYANQSLELTTLESRLQRSSPSSELLQEESCSELQSTSKSIADPNTLR